MQLQPLLHEPALLLEHERMLVFADVHIGIERDLREQGVHIPSKTQQIFDHVTRLCKQYRPQSVLVCGDVKHTIPHFSFQEEREVGQLFSILTSFAEVHVIPGNHDGNLGSLLPKTVKIHSSKGWLVGDVGFVHGHRWPSDDIMQANYVVVSHTHPTVMLRDSMGHQSFEPCWLRGFLRTKPLEKRYSLKKSPEFVVMPSFNPLCGGVAVNKENLVGPLGKSLDLLTTQVFLLDGTRLGRLTDLIPAEY